MSENITLLVSSCDKYEDAWYPYFELIKKYWPTHPENIALITETKQYKTDGLNIKTYNYPKSYTWSERLYRTLEQIDTKYIIFSLEDFFLLDYVKQDRLDECVSWMEENPDIAVCRLFSCDDSRLLQTDEYKEFYIADKNIGFRLETQAAIWNKETLMSFIDLSENPWQFEKLGTQRIKDTEKLFLWHHSNDLNDNSDKVFCYHIFPFGYGVSWGHWLWDNKAWFEKNGIKNVRYSRLGILSEKAVGRRFKHLYNQNPNVIEKLIRPVWKFLIYVKKAKSNILILGLKEGIKTSFSRTK